MSDRPLLSVCIPYFDAPRRIVRAVGSVFAQVGVPVERIQVVITSDSRDPESRQALTALRARYPVEVHYNEERAGLAGNWERALTAGTGRIRTLLHQDDWYEPDCLAAVVAAFSAAEDLVLYSPRSLIHADSSTRVYPQGRELLGRMQCSEYLGKLIEMFECPVPSATFYSGDALERLDPVYDPRYRFCPEFDLDLRLLRAHPNREAWNAEEILVSRQVRRDQYSRQTPHLRCIDYCRLLTEYRELIPPEWLEQPPDANVFGRVNTNIADSLVEPLGVPIADFAATHDRARQLAESEELGRYLTIDPEIVDDLAGRVLSRVRERPELPVWEVVENARRRTERVGLETLGHELKRHYSSRKLPDGAKQGFPKTIRSQDGFRQPVFIVGFHHSGTRLLASLLDRAGVFQVTDSRTHEWTYVQRLNSILLPDWNRPSAVADFSHDGCGFRVSKETLARRLWCHGYEGGTPWGIKDPRLMAVLDAWIAEFPKGRVVEIVRDPLDVLGTLPEAYGRFTPGGARPQEAPGFWADLYLASARRLYRSCYKSHNATRVTFEDLCSDPRTTLQGIATALDLELDLDLSDVDIKQGKVGLHREWLESGKIDRDCHRELETRLSEFRRELGYQA